ncbi:hypothetical protein [Micromonospora sp. CA-111912]|uniref:hypothetical protein n=1 Tax=Micromonospora sp. CA-111912 TaxID=3239955 RepID=UPI003D8E4F74
MRLDLHPPVGVGPAEIGASLGEAEAALASLGDVVMPDPLRPRRRGFVPFRSGLSIALHGDRGGNVIAVEIYRSDDDSVLFEGTDVFRTLADEVIALLELRTRIRHEEGGRTVVAPELSMSLWRGNLPEFPGDEDGRYFESALIAKPGYFAIPGE